MASLSITLGDVSYTMPRLSVGQYERIAELSDATDDAGREKFKFSLALAEILLSRATPPIADIRDLECSPDELARASQQIMAANGLVKDQGEPEGIAPAA